MRPSIFRLAATVAMVSIMVACGADPNDHEATPPEEAPVPSDPDTDEPDSTAPEDDTGRDQDATASDNREVTLAIADAAERTGVAASDIEVVEFALVTWPDGAIGCPEPGVVYTQALVEGYRIVLDADGTLLTYHGATGADPFLCESPADPVQPSR
ncbi:MAG: hypothetical protein EA340_07465 [Nitriliruptor sp.]|nr:MAG: hypothetical protein EA340_07465 [Nitriliruptor sp.]